MHHVSYILSSESTQSLIHQNSSNRRGNRARQQKQPLINNSASFQINQPLGGHHSQKPLQNPWRTNPAALFHPDLTYSLRSLVASHPTQLSLRPASQTLQASIPATPEQPSCTAAVVPRGRQMRRGRRDKGGPAETLTALDVGHEQQEEEDEAPALGEHRPSAGRGCCCWASRGRGRSAARHGHPRDCS